MESICFFILTGHYSTSTVNLWPLNAMHCIQQGGGPTTHRHTNITVVWIYCKMLNVHGLFCKAPKFQWSLQLLLHPFISIHAFAFDNPRLSHLICPNLGEPVPLHKFHHIARLPHRIAVTQLSFKLYELFWCNLSRPEAMEVVLL